MMKQVGPHSSSSKKLTCTNASTIDTQSSFEYFIKKGLLHLSDSCNTSLNSSSSDELPFNFVLLQASVA